MSTDTKRAPTSPATARAMSAASAGDAAISEGVSTHRYATFSDR